MRMAKLFARVGQKATGLHY